MRSDFDLDQQVAVLCLTLNGHVALALHSKSDTVLHAFWHVDLFTPITRDGALPVARLTSLSVAAKTLAPTTLNVFIRKSAAVALSTGYLG
jgi:hypothetical protein